MPLESKKIKPNPFDGAIIAKLIFQLFSQADDEIKGQDSRANFNGL